MFGLREGIVTALSQSFSHYPEIHRVIIFGSRVKGTYRPGSDIDLCIEGDMSLSTLFRLENEIDDLLLPYKIDIIMFIQISNDDLLSHIHQTGQVFYEKSSQVLPENKNAQLSI